MKLIRLMTTAMLLISVPGVILAQDEGAEYINIRIQTVKPDKVAQWESLRKEMSEAAKEAGWAFYHVYQRQLGPLPTYLIVSPASAIGEPGMAIDAPPEPSVSESWFGAMFGTLDNNSLVTLETDPGLSTLTLESGLPQGNFAHVRIRTAAAGQSADFEQWLRDDLIPGLREAGAGDVRAARVVLGGSPRTWVTFSFVPGWPEPVVELDPRIIARGDDMIATQIDYFYSFRNDLSFSSN